MHNGDRMLQQQIQQQPEKYKADLNLSASQSAGLGTLFGEILTNPLAGSLLGNVFNIPYPPKG